MICRALLLAAALLAFPATAQTRASGAARVDAEFARTDRNNDGAVSRDELARRVAHLRIGGRAVTPAETRLLADRWFARADRDRDRRVTRDETRTLFAHTFARFDLDRDGRLNPNERGAARTALLAEAVR